MISLGLFAFRYPLPVHCLALFNSGRKGIFAYLVGEAQSRRGLPMHRGEVRYHATVCVQVLSRPFFGNWQVWAFDTSGLESKSLSVEPIY
jgi:hypothetical protein